MKTLKLWVHNRSYNDTDDIRINPKEFPDVSKGDILEIYHPEDEYSRLLLQVTSLSEEFNQKDIISIEQSIAFQFQLRAYKEVHVTKVSPKDVALDLVELLFKDQYLSRSDMWRLRHRLVNTCAYLTKKVEAVEMRAQVNELWSKGDRVTCGTITEDTRIVYRSSTAVVQIYIQMSCEMWDFDINGDLYFEKAVNGFLTDLFAKWKIQNCLHDVTIVLFSRTFYQAMSKEDFPPGVRDCIQQDYQGRFYEDFYRVLVQNERYDDWTRTIKMLRKLFNEYPQRVLHYHKVKGQRMPKAWNSTATQGNFLETLNMSLNLLEKHYVDRNFDRTGKVAVVITPGPGVFEVDRELTNITKQRTIDCGVGSDLVCMGEQPLHAAPLFKFHNRNVKATLQVGDDYNIPHWMNHSFYLSKNQIQARRHGSFIPRIKPPQLRKEKKSKSKEIDFPVYPQTASSTDDDNFPFVNYDEYDAQVFKLPARNYRYPLTGRGKPRKLKKEPQTLGEAKKVHKGRTRRSSDDMLLERVVSADRQSRAISIPSRSSSGDDISSSVPAIDKHHPKGSAESSDEDTDVLRPTFGSVGSPFTHSKQLTAKTMSRRALINPFAPSSIHFKMTSNRRRWIHAFPTDPQGVAVQTHHFCSYSDGEESEETRPVHTKEVVEATQLAVEARKQRSITRHDSLEGSESTSLEPIVGSASSLPYTTTPTVVSSSLGSNFSILQDYNKLPSTNRMAKDSRRSWVWGPTGEQEWSPNMTTGQDWRPLEYHKAASSKSCLVKPILNADMNSKKFCASISVDWKSLTIPATLPITTDYFPDQRSLQTDYVFSDYCLLPEQDDNLDNQSLSADETYFKRKNLTPTQVFQELVSQRLSQGFQVIVNNSLSRKRHAALGSSPQYQHAVGLIRARPRPEQSEECYLSIGRIFHNITLTGPTITVTRYRPRHPGPELKLSYCYRFQAPDSYNYDVSWSEFRNEKLENYNWNYLDQYICTRGEGDYGLMESLKFWRSRFLIIPCNNTATKKIIDGSPRCDIYEEKSSAELQNLIHGFVKMMEILNRLKRTAKRTKLSGDSSVTPTAADSSKTTPSTGGAEANSRPRDVDTLTTGSPPTKLIEAMLDTQFGLPFLSKQPGLPSNCFFSEEAVAWCIQNVQGMSTTRQAVGLMQTLVEDQLVVHASGNPKHKFVYGFYFYCIPQVKDKVKDIEVPKVNSLFKRNFFEVTILPVDEKELQPSSHLSESSRSRSVSSINPATDDWRVETSMDTESEEWGQQSATLLHKYVTIDVDVLDKSDRPEWSSVRYHSYYSPTCAFQIELQWMVATGNILGELVYSWARKLSGCGFHLIPVPIDPFALPSAPDSDSLRGPIFVPLDINCLCDEGIPLAKDGQSRMWRERLHSFQIAVIRRYGFMPAGVRDISEDAYPMGQGEDYSYYVHCTGGNFILMEDSHVSSPTLKDTPYSSSFSKKSTSELRKDYIKRSQSSQFHQKEQVMESKIGYLWSWNFMSSKRWRSANTGDEFFQDKMLSDFRDFCSNKENRLQEFWLEWYNPFQLPDMAREATM